MLQLRGVYDEGVGAASVPVWVMLSMRHAPFSFTSARRSTCATVGALLRTTSIVTVAFEPLKDLEVTVQRGANDIPIALHRGRAARR